MKNLFLYIIISIKFYYNEKYGFPLTFGGVQCEWILTLVKHEIQNDFPSFPVPKTSCFRTRLIQILCVLRPPVVEKTTKLRCCSVSFTMMSWKKYLNSFKKNTSLLETMLFL